MSENSHPGQTTNNGESHPPRRVIGKGRIPRAGIVGAGGFGFRHAKALDILAGEGRCELVAACDPQIESVPQGWRENRLAQTRLFRTHEEMFRATELDYIVIASPPQWHEEHCLRALETDAFIYLEKPPVPTFVQLRHLLQHPRADRVAVGFQLLESAAVRELKRGLVAGELGKIREISASGLWPRATSYYERAPWAGKMMVAGRPVFDGPLTNALAHLVQNVFFLAGEELSGCACPETAAGIFARAQPIESYDFGWIKGTTESGIAYNIAAAHCGWTIIPWKVSVRTDRGVYSVGEEDIPRNDSLLVSGHRSYLSASHENAEISSRLSDCVGYSMATSAAWLSSMGIIDVPRSEVVVHGGGVEGAVYHVEAIATLIKNLRSDPLTLSRLPDWLQWSQEVNCREILSMERTDALLDGVSASVLPR